jgi:hypothetical protein
VSLINLYNLAAAYPTFGWIPKSLSNLARIPDRRSETLSMHHQLVDQEQMCCDAFSFG